MPTLNFNLNTIECVGTRRKGPYPINMEYLVIAGGGGSYTKTGNDTVGGAGAGGYITGSYCFQPGVTQTFTIGTGGVGGANPTNGNNTNAFGVTAIGGGRSGAVLTGFGRDAGNGGSGGGGLGGNFGTGSIGQGFNGGSGTGVGGGGGGGGAANSGSSTTTNTGGNGGNGKQWLDGTYYAGGGAGSNYFASSAPYGTNGLGQANAGGGAAGDGTSGKNGIVAVRYLDGEIVAVTNGTTVRTGGYTYHYFTSGTGSIQFIGDEQQNPNQNGCV
jgi:hypothetical protein